MTEPTQREGGARDVLDPVLRSAPSAVLFADADGGVVQVNDAARMLLGIPPGGPAPALPDWLARAQRSLGERTRPGGAGTGRASTGPAARGPIGDRLVEAYPVPDGGTPELTAWWLVDVTEREHAAFLIEMAEELPEVLNLERCMEVTARMAARHLADAAVVVVPRSEGSRPVACSGAGGRTGHGELPIDPAEVEGLADALRGFPPVPPRWIDPLTAPAWLLGLAPGRPAAIAVISLPGHGVPAGALVLMRMSGPEAFSVGEEPAVRLFAARAGAMLSAARLYGEQASISATLMRELLPPRALELDGVEVAARYRPSGDEDLVGGDFYDVFPAAEGGSRAGALAALGDVCGKGLEAAVLTGKIRTTLRALLPMADDHRRVLELLNGALLLDGAGRFVTLVLASARRQGADVRLRLTGAGHPAPLIVRAGGKVEAAPTRGSLIGVLDEIEVTTVEETLGPGDTCLLYTDGITEAVGGPLGDEMFGDERLRAALAGCGAMPPEALVERVHMLAAEWVGTGRHDDMAVIAITAPARGPEGRTS